MKRNGILILILMISMGLFAQSNVKKDGYNVFYHANGKKSSEGTMSQGKPDGYWKTYNENEIIKSEGNRKNYELDSLWKFYDDNGKLILEINYKNGKKNGIKKTYREKEIVAENYINDIKQGLTTYYYPDGKIMKTINFEKGMENGLSKEYAEDGTVIMILEYKKGFIINRERINRRDKNGLKQDLWKTFYENGNVCLEGTYKDDKKNGYFKQYSTEGNLLEITKYVDDVLQVEAAEIVKLDVKTDYYPDGKPKTVASYKNNIPEGVRREYSEEGKVVAGYTFKNGVKMAEGIVDDEGVKDGPWKEFFADGSLKSQGVYNADKRTGEWKFFHQNGQLEQTGKYNKAGKPEGLWQWYFADGKLLREENYINGLEDGIFTEYDEDGNVITQGEYLEGMEEGLWKYNTGDRREEGTYKSGMRNGSWKTFYPDGKLSFEGSYIDDNPNGKHTWYWDNGNRKDEGNYVMGNREGEWTSFNYDGTPFLMIYYKNGIEKSYDGIKIKPEITQE
ncbi:MAG TPA: hypothetical protein PLG86_03815 [Bacteroidales bacterium]|nr:hypothetical protein [Bacteroidales bacterium]HPT04242.1 hypothetical protein [Bacteroidales bacterium]